VEIAGRSSARKVQTMAAAGERRRYTLGEEIANSVIHGIGIVLAIAGLAVLTAFASSRGTALHVVGCSVFGSTLVLLYTASTLYHSIPSAGAKSVLQAIDHSAIFLLIAGTYTPFSLVNLRGPWGWSLLAVIWTLATLGIAVRVTRGRRSNTMAVGFYIAMGWTVLAAIKPLVAHVASGGVLLLVLGGLSYTGGAAFYLWRRLPYHHAIWHAFVLLGSIFHFFAILFYVIPLASRA
jgi:hemolysin III